MINNHLDPYGYMIPEIFYSGIPDALYDGSTVAWFLSDEPTTLTLDGANRVSRWNDFLGSGHDLIQANGADQPLWSVNGILFDGVSEFMKCGAFAYVQPEMIYMVVKQITWVNNTSWFDGNLGDRMAIRENTASPGISGYAGVWGNVNNNLVLDTWGIVRCLFNGATSKLIVNNTVPITGNFGASNAGGFTLGANAAGTIGRIANIEVKEIILRNVADTAPDEAAIYAYLSAKYGI